MQRRLYFVLPDPDHAREVVEELEQASVPRTSLHAVAREGVLLAGLPAATPVQQADRLHSLERLLWRGNLAFFFVMFALLLVGLSTGSGWLVALGVAAMVVSFVVGELWTHVPDTSLHEFDDAIAHGEVLLMVDVPPRRVDEIEHRVHRRHPEATVGGVSFLSGVGF